jgi:hypothetical protein
MNIRKVNNYQNKWFVSPGSYGAGIGVIQLPFQYFLVAVTCIRLIILFLNFGRQVHGFSSRFIDTKQMLNFLSPLLTINRASQHYVNKNEHVKIRRNALDSSFITTV